MSAFKFLSLKPSTAMPATGNNSIQSWHKTNNDFIVSAEKEEKYAHYTKVFVSGPLTFPFNPRDFDVFDEEIIFRTKLKEQTATFNLEVLSDPLFSSRFKLAGIKCARADLIKGIYCLSIKGEQTILAKPTVNNAEAITYVELPSILVVDFKMEGKQTPFKFSLLIDDLNDRSIEDFYACDPQVGNDPPP